MASDKTIDYTEQRDDHDYPAAGHTPVKMGAGRYLATRLSTLKPPMDRVENPFTLLGSLSGMNWLMFACAFLAWTWDAFDFFTVSLTVSDLAETFDKSTKDITWGITLVLMFRSVGAIIFGIAADRYGRKWPFVVNNILFIVLELGTGFCQTYKQFLACRALFGVAMGGIYGNCAATAIEDVPEKARGIVSGMLQQGYAFGYLLATAFSRALVNTTPHGWRPLFWFGACPPILFIAFRLCLPETDSFIERQRVRAAGHNVGKTFISEGKVALRRHWLLLIYLVLLMAGFNFMSHGSQDLYPTMLKNQYEFSANAVTMVDTTVNKGCTIILC
ncbi:Carboxylic acid transporter [Teratosphaeriaceae sp. CCFEE 6253]|nr:Carboxylic acid transporter [Teratosphaeriaceae sp. CCFEE 6253]